MRRRVSIFGATGSVGRNTVSLLGGPGRRRGLRGRGAERRRQYRSARRAGACAACAGGGDGGHRSAGRARGGARRQRRRGGGGGRRRCWRRRRSRSTGRCRRSSARRALYPGCGWRGTAACSRLPTRRAWSRRAPAPTEAVRNAQARRCCRSTASIALSSRRSGARGSPGRAADHHLLGGALRDSPPGGWRRRPRRRRARIRTGTWAGGSRSTARGSSTRRWK